MREFVICKSSILIKGQSPHQDTHTNLILCSLSTITSNPDILTSEQRRRD